MRRPNSERPFNRKPTALLSQIHVRRSHLARQADGVGRQHRRDAAVVRAAQEQRRGTFHQLRAGQARRQRGVRARVRGRVAPQGDLRTGFGSGACRGSPLSWMAPRTNGGRLPRRRRW